MLRKYLFSGVLALLAASVVVSQDSFKPRDADEEHAWRLYSQYLISKQNEDKLKNGIVKKSADIKTMGVGSVPIYVDPKDVAELTKMRQQLATEQERIKNLETAWDKKFWGRYGPLSDSASTIYDPKTEQTMDRIKFRLIYFPFNRNDDNSRANITSTTGSFPVDGPFNGLRINYNVKGATLYEPIDQEGYTFSRSIKGDLGSGTLSISGTVRVGGYGADATISVWVGDKKEEKKFYIENIGKEGNPQAFNLSIPIPAGALKGGFAIRLDGRYSMGGGSRACYVTGDFGPSKAGMDAERVADSFKKPSISPKTEDDAKLQESKFVEKLLSGQVITGEVQELTGPRRNRTHPLTIRITKYDPQTGAIEGELYWSTLQSINRIQGSLSGKIFEFTETEAIKAGKARLNVTYKLNFSDEGAAGSYVDQTDKSQGSIRLKAFAEMESEKFVDKLVNGELISGEAQETEGPRKNRTWTFTIRITNYDSATGNFVGEITWTTLNSVHQIRGKLIGNALNFSETEAIKAGRANLNVSYKLSLSDGSALGTYFDSKYNTSGSVRMPVPPSN